MGGASRPRPLDRPRLYEHLASHISEFIHAQGLGPGDRLPPERQFATDLGVSRATLSRALAALEVQGKVDVRHGVGAVVRGPYGRGHTGFESRVAEADVHEARVAREVVLAGIARAAAANPHTSVRIAMMGDDGGAPSLVEIFRRVRWLADQPLLDDLDRMLAENCPDPPDSPQLRARLAQVVTAVERGDPTAAAAGCAGLLTADE